MLEKLWKLLGFAPTAKPVAPRQMVGTPQPIHQPRTSIATPNLIPVAREENLLLIEKKYLTRQQLEKYRRDLVAYSKYDEDKAVSMYGEDDDSFFFPRHYFKNKHNLIARVIDGTDKGQPISFKAKINLWDYQQEAIDKFTQYLSIGKTGFFLGAAPGAGKTQIGIKMMEILDRTALIIVPKTDLVYQWVERIINTTNLRKEDIGIGKLGKLDWKNKKVVVSIVNTVVKYKANQDFRRNFGTVIFDECDSSVPPVTFALCASMFTAKYRIGMTASKTRADGLHIVFQNHISEVEINCTKSNTLKPKVIGVYFDGDSGKLPFSKDMLARKGMFLSLIAKNHTRNNMIAHYAKVASMDDNKPTVVISDRKEQLKEIEQILINTYHVPVKDIGYYVGSLDNNKDRKKENKRVADNCKIILATYGQMSRGTDVPRLECIILATPRNDLRQVAGRVERANPGKGLPYVIDIIDTKYSLANSGSEQRQRYYNSRNLEVIFHQY